jgi:hypothetical protein
MHTPAGFAPTPHDQHVGVDKLDWIRFVAWRDDCLGDQHSSMWRQRISAIPQDRDRRIIIPVVDDFLQNIHVATLWKRFEKATGYQLGAWQAIPRARFS